MSGLRPWTSRRRLRLSNHRIGIDRLNSRTWLDLERRGRFGSLPANKRLGCLNVAGVGHPLFFRNASSDPYVLRQVFVERAYACFDHLNDPGLILDCGANAGYASAYFLSRFPGCIVMAVEPDPENFAILSRNLAPFGSRVRAIHGAVWSHPCFLRMAERGYRGGLEWASQVTECAPGEVSSLPGYDIAGLLEESGFSRISLLKMDIEGAETVVFSRHCESWLDRVDHLAVELHDDSMFGPATPVFHDAISGQAFSRTSWGELTICSRIDRSPDEP